MANEALDKLGGWIGFGPTLNREVPVALTLESIFVDGNTLTIDAYANGAIDATSDTPLSDTPQTIGANVKHMAGFTLGFGLFFSVGLLKVFSLNLNTTPVDFFDLLGLPNPIPTTALSGSVVSNLNGGGIIEPVKVSLQLPGSATAGSSVSGTISLDSAATSSRQIALTADIASANVPAFVTIPAGQSSASFTFTPGNACSGSGESFGPGSSYTVKVSAVSDLPPSPTASLVVSNRALSVNFATTNITLSSGVTSSQGTITLPWAAPNDTMVSLDFLDFEHNPTENSATFNNSQAFPGTVTIPKGQTSVPITVFFTNGGPGYAFGFFLTADTGCAFGKNEINFTVTK